MFLENFLKIYPVPRALSMPQCGAAVNFKVAPPEPPAGPALKQDDVVHPGTDADPLKQGRGLVGNEFDGGAGLPGVPVKETASDIPGCVRRVMWERYGRRPELRPEKRLITQTFYSANNIFMPPQRI
jgi:hypothetical protein